MPEPKESIYLLDNIPHDWLFLRCKAVVRSSSSILSSAVLKIATTLENTINGCISVKFLNAACMLKLWPCRPACYCLLVQTWQRIWAMWFKQPCRYWNILWANVMLPCCWRVIYMLNMPSVSIYILCSWPS